MAIASDVHHFAPMARAWITVTLLGTLILFGCAASLPSYPEHLEGYWELGPAYSGFVTLDKKRAYQVWQSDVPAEAIKAMNTRAVSTPNGSRLFMEVTARVENDPKHGEHLHIDRILKIGAQGGFNK